MAAAIYLRLPVDGGRWVSGTPGRGDVPGGAACGRRQLSARAGFALCVRGANVCWSGHPEGGSVLAELPSPVQPGVPRGDPLLLPLAVIERRSRHRAALTVTQRKNLFSEA